MMPASRRPRKPARRRRLRTRPRWFALLALVLLGGCPARFDPRADPVGARPADPDVDRAYRLARGRYDQGELPAARDGFRALRIEHSTDPVAPVAALWEARADLGMDDPQAAVALLEPMAAGPAGDPVAERARFLLGLSLVRLGDAARAHPLLRPFAQLGVTGDDALELHAALAEAASGVGEVGEALAEFERFYADGRPAEQAYVRARARAVVAGLADDKVQRTWAEAPAGSLARAVLAASLAARTADPAQARAIRREGDEAAGRFGLGVESPTPAQRTNGRSVGLVLPLSGKSRSIGERALRGALVAANALPQVGRPLDLRVRDSGSRPEQAAAALEDLAREGVVAVVGSPDRPEAAALAARAAALGIPLLDLAPPAEEPAHPSDRAVFRVLRPNVARAEALAAHALKAGARRAATLSPDTPYGRKMAEAFAAAVRAGGGQVVGELRFAEKATTFIAPAKQLARLRPAVVFVPTTAGQLELITAQLAAAGVTRAERGKRAAAALYATADGLGPRFLTNAGRYAQGAVLSPVFLPEGRTKPFDRFRTACGDEPGAADAVAYDAVAAVRDAVMKLDSKEEEPRRALPGLLAAGRADGLTGPVAFGAAGERLGRPSLFVVDGEQIRPLP